MKHYLFPLIAVICCLFMSSCGEDNPIIGLGDVEKSDLTGPWFLAYDNTLDEPTKKIWAFNETEAAKGSITLVDKSTLRITTDWFFNSWTLANKQLTLEGENKKVYDLKQVSVLSYTAIAFGTTYVCIPSTNKGLNGIRYEDDWSKGGLTRNAFWEALRKSYTEGTSVDIKLNK